MGDKLPRVWAIGIDIGTANTRVAVYRNGQVEIIPDADGSRSMPSFVSFTNRARLIGSPAKRQLVSNIDNTVFNAKRLLGLPFSQLQRDLRYYPFKVVDNGGEPAIEVDFLGQNKKFTIVEILSMILSKARENAEAYLGSRAHNVFLSVPAYFSMYQDHAIRDAALIAGLNVLNILRGPSAVSVLLQFKKLVGDTERIVLIYDLGAGFCNAVLAVHVDGVIEVKAVASDNYLGGEDFVNRLVNHFANEFKRRRKLDVTTSKQALRRLRTACESAKCALSSASEANIRIDQFYNGLDFQSSITREKFEDICQDLFQCALQPVTRVLSDATIEASKVDDVVIVGGSSRIPRVQKLLTDFFRGKQPSKFINLEEGEVSGLAILAAVLGGDPDPRLNEYLLLTVLPISIHFGMKGGRMEKIIPRNCTIPTKKSEAFQTPWDCTQVLCLYEGERLQAKDNRLLGEIRLAALMPSPPQTTVVFLLTVDIDPKLEIRVRVEDRPLRKSITEHLGAFSIPNKDLNRMLEAEERYKLADQVEEARLLKHCALDAQIASLGDSLRNSTPSARTLHLLESLDQIRDWSDQNPHANIAEYHLRSRDLAKIKADIEVISLTTTEQQVLTSQLPQVRQIPSTDTQAVPIRKKTAEWVGKSSKAETYEEYTTPMLFDGRMVADGKRATSAWSHWLDEFNGFRNRILPDAVDSENQERVRVTIIDTGIDCSHPFIQSNGWSSYDRNAEKFLFCDFANQDEGRDVHEPIDQDGHGTFIAGILLQVAPDIELSVARIGSTRESIQKDDRVNEKIGRAINHAIKAWNTEIISISFGSEDLSPTLRNAINKANKHNIIVLAAAGNFGNTRSISYPARKNGVFKIFATDTLGKMADFSPPQDDDWSSHCFFMPGCDIVSTWPSNLRTQGEADGLDIFCWDSQAGQPNLDCQHSKTPCDWRTTMSGTSFATPIVAAVVAIIYQFYNVNRESIKLRPGCEDEFKTADAVLAILTQMSRTSFSYRYKFIEPVRGREDQFCFKRDPQTSRKGGRDLNIDSQTPVDFFSKRLSEVLRHANI